MWNAMFHIQGGGFIVLADVAFTEAILNERGKIRITPVIIFVCDRSRRRRALSELDHSLPSSDLSQSRGMR
jgi:hypothetical protein